MNFWVEWRYKVLPEFTKDDQKGKEERSSCKEEQIYHTSRE